MKKIKCFFFFLPFLFPFNAHCQIIFNDYFVNKTLRIDYHLSGDAAHTRITLDQMNQEPYWGGSKKHLVDTFRYGEYMLEVYDPEKKTLIYSRGFSTLFREWQATAEAKNIKKTFNQAVTIPFPKKPVEIKFLMRTTEGEFTPLYSQKISPDDYFIVKEPPLTCETEKIYDHGKPKDCLDIVFLAEGYTSEELTKFIEDVRRFGEILFEAAPFDKYKKKINIWAVKSVSQESGTDVPGEGIFRNTVFHSSYYTFGIPRYLTTSDMKTLRNYAANVPYDQICVLINTDRYGGGGVYNHYMAFTADHDLSPYVFVHEFGHGFAGLGDEYYTSDVTFENYYSSLTEPWEPNLTTRINFEKKWKDMLQADIPVPTPRSGQYKNITGVFEGGGYVSKGVYSPAMDCLMKSNEAQNFCPVCQRAIVRMIRFYVEE